MVDAQNKGPRQTGQPVQLLLVGFINVDRVSCRTTWTPGRDRGRSFTYKRPRHPAQQVRPVLCQAGGWWRGPGKVSCTTSAVQSCLLGPLAKACAALFCFPLLGATGPSCPCFFHSFGYILGPGLRSGWQRALRPRDTRELGSGCPRILPKVSGKCVSWEKMCGLQTLLTPDSTF